MKKIIRNSAFYLLLVTPLVIWSCKEDPAPVVEPPLAGFSFVVNELEVTFSNSSVDAESYSWDFGDGNMSAEASPKHTYTASGTYSVKLIATNTGGTDDITQELSVSGFGPNLIANGDFEDNTGWVGNQLWTSDDNAVGHDFDNGTYAFKTGTYTDADGMEQSTYWSNYVLYQEVELEVGKTYQLDGDLSSSSGTLATWFEVYLVPATVDEIVNEDPLPGGGAQFEIKAFGDDGTENCSASPFEGTLLEIAANCTKNDFSDKLMGANGQFTVVDSVLSNGKAFLAFKVGSGFAPDGEVATFGDGIILDNVVIKEVL